MKDNLDQQLDEVTSFLSEYWNYRNKLRSRLFESLAVYAQAAKYAFSNRGKATTFNDIISGRNYEANKYLYTLVATEEEKNSQLFQSLTSDYLVDAISRDLEGKFKHVDFQKIKQLHDSRKQRLAINDWHLIGVVLGVSSLILKTVPKKVIEESLKWQYDNFELAVFYITMATIVYLSIIIIPLWWYVWKGKPRHNFIAQILEYTSIRKETS